MQLTLTVPEVNLLAGASGLLCEYHIVEHIGWVNRPMNIVLKLWNIASAEDSDNIWHIFLHSAMLAKYMLSSCVCPSLRLSVRPSVTSRHCTKRAKCRIMQTMPYHSSVTVVYWRQRSRQNSNGVTPNGGTKWRWGRFKSAIFDNISLYLRSGAR